VSAMAPAQTHLLAHALTSLAALLTAVGPKRADLRFNIGGAVGKVDTNLFFDTIVMTLNLTAVAIISAGQPPARKRYHD
jgi:hypothetical protein